jgi:zinc D-Ala-D-Ala carboxypeptidase
MQVTDHFHVAEFASRDGRLYPADWVRDRLRPLCQTLEVIRSAIGGLPIVIVSGYRSPEHNARVKGARNSQHMAGRAADIRVADLSADMLWSKIRVLYSAGQLPHLGGLGRYKSWVHVDVRGGERLAMWSGKGVDVG